MIIPVDLRLIEVSFALDALDDYLELLEKEIERLEKIARAEKDSVFSKKGLSWNDPERQRADEDYYYKVDYLFPFFFRGPFLVSLYALYESSITEIAQLINNKQKNVISLDDLRGSFLERSNKYFKSIIGLKLYNNNDEWQRIQMLSELRHTVVHANGRLNMLNTNIRKKIKNWEKRKIGISVSHGFIVFDKNFTRETFRIVSNSLEALVNRYKQLYAIN